MYLAGCKAGVREMLEAAKFYEKIDKDILFVRVHDAVLTALERDPDLLQVVSYSPPGFKYLLLSMTCQALLRVLDVPIFKGI